MTSKLLQCPDCGSKRFNWVLKQVQIGNIHRFDDGTIDGEGMKMGEVVGSDLYDKGPWCMVCDEHKRLHELEVVEEE